jgi:hypothetical protein
MSEPSLNEVYDDLFPKVIEKGDLFVTNTTPTQLGNGCFIAATGVAYALDNGCAFALDPTLKKRYPVIFDRFPDYDLKKPKSEFVHDTLQLPSNILKESINLKGFFNSDYYFSKYRNIIIDLFKPTEEITLSLKKKYGKYLSKNSSYVGIHLRTFVSPYEDEEFYPEHFFKYWGTHPLYYYRAMKLFPKNTTFIVFSDNIEVAKKLLSLFKLKFIYQENSTLIEDFYLMSMMESMIIPNSSFSVFACYLNTSPTKIIVKPPNTGSATIYDPTWNILDYKENDFYLKYWYNICKNEFNLMRANQKDHKSH